MKNYETLRVPKIFDLRADPFERGDSSFLYDNWMIHRVFITYGAQALVAQWLSSFKDYSGPAEACQLQSRRGDAEAFAYRVKIINLYIQTCPSLSAAADKLGRLFVLSVVG